MIIRNNRLVLEAQKEILDTIEGVQQKVQKKIGAIYKGTNLIWLTIYNAIKSCFGGTWLDDKPWLNDEPWSDQ